MKVIREIITGVMVLGWLWLAACSPPPSYPPPMNPPDPPPAPGLTLSSEVFPGLAAVAPK